MNNIPSLVQILAWRWQGDKPLSEPMMVSLLTICESLGLDELICNSLSRGQWLTANKENKSNR